MCKRVCAMPPVTLLMLCLVVLQHWPGWSADPSWTDGGQQYSNGFCLPPLSVPRLGAIFTLYVPVLVCLLNLTPAALPCVIKPLPLGLWRLSACAVSSDPNGYSAPLHDSSNHALRSLLLQLPCCFFHPEELKDFTPPIHPWMRPAACFCTCSSSISSGWLYFFIP